MINQALSYFRYCLALLLLKGSFEWQESSYDIPYLVLESNSTFDNGPHVLSLPSPEGDMCLSPAYALHEDHYKGNSYHLGHDVS